MRNKVKITYEVATCEFEKTNMEMKITRNEFVNGSTPIPYTCKICGHESRVTVVHLRLGRGCEKCRKKVAVDKQRFSYEFVYTYFEQQGCQLLSKEYINKDTPLEYNCICGNIGRTCFNSFKRGHRCKNCKYLKVSEKKITPLEDVERIFQESGCVLLSTEHRSGVKLKYICICGNIDYKTLSKFKLGQRCDSVCGMLKRKNKLKHDIEYIKNYFEEYDCKLLSTEYINMHGDYLDFICHCGNQSSSTFGNFRLVKGCGLCSSPSKGEDKIKEYFDNKGICYARQVGYKNCKYIHILKFDFAVLSEHKDISFLIEYDGEGHFAPIEHWGGQEAFEKQKIKDGIKNKYCIENNIPLIRIPYWEFDNIRAILDEIFAEEGLMTSSFLIQNQRGGIK